MHMMHKTQGTCCTRRNAHDAQDPRHVKQLTLPAPERLRVKPARSGQQETAGEERTATCVRELPHGEAP